MSVKAKDFKGSRLEVGLTVLDQPRTLYEIATLQGKPSGSLSGLVRRMVADEQLKADADPPTQGTLYEVHPAAREALLEAAEGFQRPGTLVKNQALLSVSGGPGRIAAMRLLGSGALSGAVSWVARINSADALLVAMNPTADVGLVDALFTAFAEDGFEVREGAVTQIMSARETRDHIRKVTARAKGAR